MKENDVDASLRIYISTLRSVCEALDKDRDLKRGVRKGISLVVKMVYEDLEILSKRQRLDVAVSKN